MPPATQPVIRLQADKLNRYLSLAGISRDELARRMGMAPSTAYRVERGDVEPSPRFIAAAMRQTGLGFDALFEIVDVPEPMAAS